MAVVRRGKRAMNPGPPMNKDLTIPRHRTRQNTPKGTLSAARQHEEPTAGVLKVSCNFVLNFPLRPFQRKFLKAATADGIDTAVLSLPRGNGKSWLAGYLVARILNPTDVLFRPGTESVLCAASIEQARIVFRFARQLLEPRGGYRFLDSATRVAILHKETNTRLRVIGSNGKTAMGLVNTPWAICDEPGAWETNGGTLLHDAIETAKGKPGSPLRAVYIGTLAPSLRGWWHDLVNGGSGDGVHIKMLQGDARRWDDWKEILRVNPLAKVSPEFRDKLKKERKAALADSRLKARFLSYRLNLPSADESDVLLTAEDWQRVLGRPVADRIGRPIVAIDLGAGRAWSAAVALWPSGRMEALAVTPGIPDIAAQERRDLVPRGTYRKLVEAGTLTMADGLRVPPPSLLVNRIRDAWGMPAGVICDRFRLSELRDASLPCPLEPRVSRWSESAFDIRALRKMAKDGPLSCEERTRALVIASLTAAMVENDSSGNMRLVKNSTRNTGRDDVAAALVLAAGAYERRRAAPVNVSYGGLV